MKKFIFPPIKIHNKIVYSTNIQMMKIHNEKSYIFPRRWFVMKNFISHRFLFIMKNCKCIPKKYLFSKKYIPNDISYCSNVQRPIYGRNA